VEAEFAESSLASTGVLEIGVATIDDDVAVVEVRQECVDRRVGALARLHHDQDAPRALE
jgi:hypothetical protein